MIINTNDTNIYFYINENNITTDIFINCIEYFGIYIPNRNIKKLKMIYDKLIIDDFNVLKIITIDKTYYIKNLDEEIYINIKNINIYLKQHIDTIYIKTLTGGRYGNKLIQYNNAIIFALKHNINKVIFIDKIHFIKNNTLILSDYNKIKNNITYIQKFFVTWIDLDNKLSDTGYIQDINLYGKYYTHTMSFYIKDNLMLNYKYNNIFLLTIHIRSGDISHFPNIDTNNYKSSYGMFPSSYYIYIINKYKFNNILIITENNKNNIIDDIILYCENNNIKINIQSSNLKNDIEKIIESNHFVIAKSTFSLLLSCFLNINCTIYVPTYSKYNYIYCKSLYNKRLKVEYIDISNL